MPQNILADSNYNHLHNTRNKAHMRIDIRKHEFTGKTFFYEGIRFWDFILDNIDINVSMLVFKNVLTKFILVSKLNYNYSK